MPDTAALVVALTAQLTKFEKDMKDAVTIADKRTKEIETSFSRMNAEISNQFSSLTSSLSSRIGGLGSILGTLGPVGTGIAVGIGAAVLAIDRLIEASDRYAESQKKLKEASETTGLSINQFKALSRVGQAVGIDAGEFEGAMEKMTVAIAKLQKTASGELFDNLRKFPAVITALSNAKDPAQAIDILATAVTNMGSAFEKNAFLRSTFGRGGIPIGRLLEQVDIAGGVKALVDAQQEAGKSIDEDLNAKIVRTKIEIDKAKKAQEEFLGKMVTAETQQAQLDYLNFWTNVITLIGDANKKMSEGQSAGGALFRAIRNRIFGDTSGLSGITTGPTLEQAGRVPGDQQTAAAAQFPGGVPLPTSRPAEPVAGPTLAQRIRDTNDMIAALGQAATLTELFTQKQQQLQKQLSEGVINQRTYNRSIAELGVEQEKLKESTRERLGVATEEQIVTAKLNEIQEQQTKGVITSTQAIQAQTIARKEGREQAEQLAVRTSKLPELTRFGIDAANGFKQFDQITTQTFSNFENALGSVANGTTKLADAFKNMTNSIISDLVRIAIRMSVTGPLAGALGGLFGGGSAGSLAGAQDAGWFAPLSAGSFLPQRQGGGPVSANSAYIVGEHGAELFVPNSAGKIIPHGSGAGGTTVEINNFVASDTETKQQTQSDGAGGERIVIDIVKRASARGEFDDANRGRFGLRPQKVR